MPGADCLVGGLETVPVIKGGKVGGTGVVVVVVGGEVVVGTVGWEVDAD